MLSSCSVSFGFKVGEIVADYEITGVLGTGGMSAVYQVRHLISDRTEAMKVLLPDLEGDPDLAERFVREIRLLARLSHPGIAILHTAFRYRNQLLMVMELVKGETIDVALRREGVNLARAINFTLQILNALAYAHNQSIVHRDIKPSNVMLTSSGEVKLLDFGIALSALDLHLTQNGAALGSFHYMSPEQVRGLPVDHRTDLYSTGITLYEMATGVRPFAGSDAYTVMKAQMEGKPIPPESLNPAIKSDLSRVLMRALMKEPAERFQTAEDFAASLQSIQSHYGCASVDSIHNPVVISLPPQNLLSGVSFTPEDLDRTAEVLAEFIGPVAKILVRREAKKASSWKELHQTLASEVPERERSRFFASLKTDRQQQAT